MYIIYIKQTKLVSWLVGN